MSYRYSTALSHLVLSGTGIYCFSRYHEGKLPSYAYSIIISNSILGVWRWGNPRYGHKVNSLYNFTLLLQMLTSLPFVVTQVWLNLNYTEELAMIHSGASILPFCLYLANRSKEDVIDAIIAVNVISLGVVSLLHENYYGVAASVSYFFNHFFLREGRFDVDLPVTDLYNYAPMVRVGTLPMRLLALDYGADIVYSEELIDWKFLRTIRRVNDVLGTVDFIDRSDGTVVFRTCKREKEKVVIQLGTCDPERALKVAKLIENDVAGIDINMGCPKEFSLKGGMGAALLRQPEKAKTILSTLVQNVKVPITCKIRVLSSIDDTVILVKELVSTGISAIAVHGRTKDERPQHPNRNDTIRKIAESVHIPVIANGGSREIEKYSDINKFRDECGCSSVMIARTAQGNCSIFRRQGQKELDAVIIAYLKYAVDYDNSPSNTKYCIQNMLKELQETPKGKKFLECQTLEQICSLWNLGNYCREKELEYQAKGNLGRRQVTPDMFNPSPKRLKLNSMSGIAELRCAFIRASYTQDSDLPKTKLIAWCSKNKVKSPTYETMHEDKLFRSIVTLDGKKYSSTFWEKNKRFAEQGAALACLCSLGLVDIDSLIENGSVLQ